MPQAGPLAMSPPPADARIVVAAGPHSGGTINSGRIIGPAGIIVCSNLDAIPPGRQRARILKCGIAGCTSTRLFDRKYELERHMKTHEEGDFACLVAGCERVARTFTRFDKLREHMRKVHGI